MSRSRPGWIEPAGMTALVAGSLLVANTSPPFPGRDILPALCMLYAPWLLAAFQRKDPAQFGFHLRQLDRRSLSLLGLAIVLTIFVYVPLLWGARALWTGSAAPLFRPMTLSALATFSITQILAVALPEEVFFRGYLLTRLRDLGAGTLERMSSARGAEVFAIVGSSLLFAAVHLLHAPEAERLLTFFPGLVFGFLWVRTKSLVPGILFHAFCST